MMAACSGMLDAHRCGRRQHPAPGRRAPSRRRSAATCAAQSAGAGITALATFTCDNGDPGSIGCKSPALGPNPGQVGAELRRAATAAISNPARLGAGAGTGCFSSAREAGHVQPPLLQGRQRVPGRPRRCNTTTPLPGHLSPTEPPGTSPVGLCSDRDTRALRRADTGARKDGGMTIREAARGGRGAGALAVRAEEPESRGRDGPSRPTRPGPSSSTTATGSSTRRPSAGWPARPRCSWPPRGTTTATG
jgi:hypothetical protein